MHEARHRRLRPRVLAALAVAAAGLVGATWLPGRHDVASAAELRTVFTDDFAAPAGTRVDPTTWSGLGRAGAVQDGAGDAVLTRPIRTRAAFAEAYGHAEARIRVSRQPGVWRAFSAFDQDGRFIPGRLGAVRGAPDPTAGSSFHTYAIDWSPRLIVWSVDGRPALLLTPARRVGGVVLVLNVAAHGFAPGRMVVDFVHVTAANRPGHGTPAPTAAPSVPPSPHPSAPAATKPAPKARAWHLFTDFAAGDLVTFKGRTYRVVEAHTSLPGWEPTALPRLFRPI